MRPAGIALAAMLAASALASAGDTEPRAVKTGESFELGPGGAVRADGQALEIRFEKVVADSRCPKGAQCVWAGDATVRLSLKRGEAARETCDVRLSTAQAVGTGDSDLHVRLLGLTPFPVSGRVIDPRDYRARLELTHGSDTPDAQ
jgi:hypothetical protein